MLFQQTTWLISFAKKHPLNRYWVPIDTKTDELLKGLFLLPIASWIWTLLLIHYSWILTTFKVLFSYLTLMWICHGKNVKIIFQPPQFWLGRLPLSKLNNVSHLRTLHAQKCEIPVTEEQDRKIYSETSYTLTHQNPNYICYDISNVTLHNIYGVLIIRGKTSKGSKIRVW